MKTKLLITAILILITAKAEAFTFDVWESGMDADTVIMTAMKEDLPLAAEGRTAIGGGGKFYKPACIPYRKTATRYHYNTELLGERARITLFMTEKDKRLMKIEISWNHPKTPKEFKKLVEKIILKKKPISRKTKQEMFAKTVFYKMNNHDTIGLKYQMGDIYLTYYDLELIASDTVKKREKKQQKLIKDVSKDWKKF